MVRNKAWGTQFYITFSAKRFGCTLTSSHYTFSLYISSCSKMTYTIIPNIWHYPQVTEWWERGSSRLSLGDLVHLDHLQVCRVSTNSPRDISIILVKRTQYHFFVLLSVAYLPTSQSHMHIVGLQNCGLWYFDFLLWMLIPPWSHCKRLNSIKICANGDAFVIVPMNKQCFTIPVKRTNKRTSNFHFEFLCTL